MLPIMRGILLLGALCILIACAPSRNLLRTSTNYEKTFKAAAQAVVEAGFSVQSSDVTTGVISAQRAVREARQDRYFRFNVLVSRSQKGSEVQAVAEAPPGSVSGTQAYVDAFVKALKRQLPDVEVVTSQ